MQQRNPRVAAVTMAAAAAFTVPLTAAAPATAAPAAAASSCYGGATKADFYSSSTIGDFVTTSRCHDINIRIIGGKYPWLKVCVVFVKHTDSCNYQTTVRSSWVTIATDVKDGTEFTVRGGGATEGDYAFVELAF